jgi:hypothetical protein
MNFEMFTHHVGYFESAQGIEHSVFDFGLGWASIDKYIHCRIVNMLKDGVLGSLRVNYI